MKSLRRIAIVIFSLILFVGSAASNASLFNSLDMKIGIFAGANSNEHKADFMHLPDIPNCCSEYGNARSLKPGLKVFAEIGVLSFLDFQVATTYNQIGANLQSQEYIGNTQINSQLYPVFTTHNLESDLGVLSFHPSISIRPYQEIPIRFGFGFEIGTIVDKDIYQHEDLSREAIENGIIFYDGVNEVGTSRNIYKGDIPYVNTYNSISFSVAYDIYLTNKILIRPELNYRYCLNDIVPNVSWKINNTTLGISICYDLSPDPFDIEHFKDRVFTREIPDRIAQEKDDFKKEVQKTEDFLDQYSKSKEGEEVTEDKKAPVGTTTDFSCCYIIFYSSTKLNESESVLNRINKAAEFENIFIQEWMNPSTEIIYYRVRTKCFREYFKALEAENIYKNMKLKIDQPAIIKCY